ncbi:hypothetical protein [Roseibium suaedae]|uniref:hypothetical protein n=1 Tax=Roseibium suaedae TaxID=735517 RepID=UPI000933F728|nr:hypothetical protein [Roseibium suaedae]
MFRLFTGKEADQRSARIVNRGTCLVRMGKKGVSLAVDWAPEGDPEFIIYIRTDTKWETPVSEPVSEAEIAEMLDFIPKELRKRERVEASIELIAI